MRESLREFICREAGPDAENRLSLVRYLAPSILVAGGYDFNELRQLIQYGPGWESSFGSEYVSDTWPEVPVADPLPCITIRPFTPDGYTTTPYELVTLLTWHLRDVLVGAEPAPDFDGIIRFGYIEPESIARWKEAAERWRASRADEAPQTIDTPRPLQRQAAQGLAILEAIRQAKYDPLKLPRNKPGKPGIKAQVRKALNADPMFTGTTVFDGAWERLSADGDIAFID